MSRSPKAPASAVGPVTVRAEGVRLNGKPVCNRFAIEYPNGIGHIEFSDENAAAIERAVNSHADLLAALEAIEFALRLPGVTPAEVLDEGSAIRAGIRAAIARATGERKEREKVAREFGIAWDGDRWQVVGLGATREDGRVFAHLASMTRGARQRNGWCPIQICDWLPPELVAARD